MIRVGDTVCLRHQTSKHGRADDVNALYARVVWDCDGSVEYWDIGDLTVVKQKSQPETTTPDHYTKGLPEGVGEVWELIVALGIAEEFAVGNAIKYIYRYKDKNGLEDLKKAHDYLGKLIELKSSEESQ